MAMWFLSKKIFQNNIITLTENIPKNQTRSNSLEKYEHTSDLHHPIKR